ncbi:MAG TPA: response regulator transcription factor [bacterium]|nr:response regulator transcription factor [bacterium]
MKILVVEDEKKIAEFVRKGLEEHGFDVDICGNGNDAWFMLSTRTYDTAVLDIMLPGRDGLSVLRQLRRDKIATPVIILTARGEPYERTEGLNLGADDYVTKPFYMEELVARIHAVIRRHTGERLSRHRVGDITMNLLSREVQCGSEIVELTTREFSLLEVLMRSPGYVFTRTQLLEHVWGYDFDPGTNVVDVTIRRLRNKLNDTPERPIIETVRGVGYRMIKR